MWKKFRPFSDGLGPPKPQATISLYKTEQYFFFSENIPETCDDIKSSHPDGTEGNII